MRNGIHIPGTVVRIMVSALAAAFVASLVANGPDAVRYLKMKRL
jgi:hypothetical protein